MKRWIAWAMAACMAAGSMGVTAYGSTFADIGKVPWPGAATFIDQAASLGLMNGYNEDGKKYCKPKNDVSYCEAVQLMYSIMKAHSKQDVSDTVVTKWKPVMGAYNIPSWAYNAVAYGLENGIVATDELGKMRNGTGNANREEVGRIFGKALATLDGYSLQSNATLSYRDAAQVSSDAKPYLELLNRSKLMVGDTDNNFNPRSNINRSEMAVLSVKTYNTLTQNAPATTPTPSTGSVSGTVVNSMVLTNGDLFLSLKTSAGAGLNLFGTKGSLTPTYENKSIAFTDIGTGDTVTVAYTGDQLKSLVVNTSKAGISKDVTYELKKVTSSKVTVVDGSRDREYYLDNNAEIRLDGARSTTGKVSSALEDAKYNVTLTLDKDEYVTKLDAVKSSDNPTKGLLTKLSDSKVTIKSGSKSFEFTLEDNVSVKLDGKSYQFSKLQKNYKDNNYTISLTLNSKGRVSTITIDEVEDETHGTLTQISTKKIYIEANGSTHSYPYLEDDLDVYIDGKKKTLATLKDNLDDGKGYTAALEVDKDDVATEIRVTSKNIENSKGTLTEIDSSEITITKDKKDYTYDLSKDITVTVDGKKSSVSDLKKNYKDYSYEVELEFDSDGDVTKIKATIGDVEEGILKDIDDRYGTIKVEAGGVNYDLSYSSSVKATLDGKSIDLDDLNEELNDTTSKEQIYVTLSYSGSKVSKITAKWTNESDTVKGELYSINSDDYELRIVKGSSKTTYTIHDDVDVTLDKSSSSVSKLKRAFDALGSDERIDVTLTLNSKEKVTKIAATTVSDDDDDEDKPKEGYLRSIKTSGDGSVTIAESKKSSAKTYTWDLDSNVKISYSINDDDTYDGDYKETLNGLKKFMNACEGNGDSCRVTLRTNSAGDVTTITAEDQQ